MQSSLPVSKTQETLLKAFEQLTVNHNPQYALLIAFIAAEVMLGYYLHEAKVKRGASKTKLDDYEEEVPFSYKLNIELPVLLGNIDENDRQTIAAVDKVRKKRNSIVHRGEDVSIEEALSGINAVGHLHDMLGKRPI